MRSLFVLAVLALFAVPLRAAPFNQEVLDLLEAEMSEEVILAAVQSARAEGKSFDTSAKALIILKKAGASPAILKAVAAGGEAKNAPQPVTNKRLKPDEVRAVDDSHSLHHESYQLSKRGVNQRVYASLRGTRSDRRLAKSGVYIMPVKENMAPERYVYLARWVPTADTREVVIAQPKGLTGVSTGIPSESLLPLKFEKNTDQSAAPEGYVVYTVAYAAEPGEYAFILSDNKECYIFPFGVDSAK